MQVCTSLQTDNHASTPPLCFLQAGCPSCRPTNSVKALKALALAPVKSRLFLPFWHRLTQVVLEKRPLNGSSSSSSIWTLLGEMWLLTVPLCRLLLLLLYEWNMKNIQCALYRIHALHSSDCSLTVWVFVIIVFILMVYVAAAGTCMQVCWH